jgi:mycobactin polyketide synthetase MbtD
MVAIGLDSLQALEFRRRVKIELNYELEVADLLGGASIAEVLAKLET